MEPLREQRHYSRHHRTCSYLRGVVYHESRRISLSPAGKALGRIVPPPEHDANFAFGDSDGKSLYLTASTGLYRIRVNVPGIRPPVSIQAASR
jgi:sugar lactone lactonase YvrE